MKVTMSSYTVIYDGDCRVCGRMVKLLAGWDRGRELEMVPSQAPAVRARFPWVLPKGGLLSWLFRIPFARPLADKFYSWFARNRYRMGCGDHCAVRPSDPDYRDGEAGQP